MFHWKLLHYTLKKSSSNDGHPAIQTSNAGQQTSAFFKLVFPTADLSSMSARASVVGAESTDERENSTVAERYVGCSDLKANNDVEILQNFLRNGSQVLRVNT